MHLKLYHKLWLKMKLTTFLLIVGLMQASAASYSQVTIQEKNISIQALFKSIEKQSSYTFLYKIEDLNGLNHLSVDFKDQSVEQILTQGLRKTPLEFKIVGQTVLVKKKPEVKSPSATQQDTISGIVTDEEGVPLPGVTVQVKGTRIATGTDENGRFVLQNVPAGATLEFALMGYTRIEQPVVPAKLIRARLTIAATELSDVTISTGFQRRERNKMIGAVSSIKGEDIQNAGITTIDKALRGRLSGVYVRSVSGRPGETGEIIIRGSNTMTGNKQPLIILDGMPLQGGEVSGDVNSLMTNGIGNIPPEDIESIDILRDATAASVYGARAANGVIVITTKKGEVGKDYVSYSGRQEVTFRPENKFNFMNSAEKLAFERRIYEDFHPIYGGRATQLLLQADNGVISHANANQAIDQLGTINTNWIKELYRPAYSHSHNLSFSGGNVQTQYNVSLNYQDAQGTLMENRFQLGGLNMKIARNINNKLLFNINVYSTLKKNTEGASALDPFRYAVFANPYEQPYNEDGSYAWDMTYRNLTNNISYNSDLNYKTFNIIRELKENRNSSVYGNVRGQLGVEYSFLSNLRYSGTAVVNYESVHNTDESQAGTYRSWANSWLNSAASQVGILPKFNQGFLEESMGRTFDFTIRNTLEFNKTFAGKHFLQVFGAHEVGGRTNYQFNHFNPIYLEQYRMAGYPTWDFINPEQYKDLDLSRFGGTFFNEDRSVSFISSLVYSYDNRYVANANFRSDGVDIIGSDNQFTPLWSAGVRWNAHEESFITSMDETISRLSLSAGYGFTGSINRSVYPFHTHELSALAYDDVTKSSSFIYGNPVLKWEKKRDLNLSMELSLLKGRYNFVVNYFDSKVTDLLDNVRLPVSVGRPDATVNVGQLSNKGWELSARVELIKTQNLLWEIGGNLTTIENNLDQVYVSELPNIANSYTQNIEGYSINSWFGYKVSHVNPENGHLMVKALRKHTTLEGTEVVDSYEEEIIDLHTISSAELQANYRTYALGHKDPNLYGGFRTRVVYDAFEFTSNFVFASGNKILGFQDRKEGPGGAVDEVTASRTNRLKEQQHRWRQPDDITNIAVYGNNLSNYTRFLVDRDLEDGSYLRCTEIGIGWRANEKLLGNGMVKQLRLGITANNLFMLSKYSGTDAESQIAFGYPTTKSVNFSLRIGF